MNETGWRENQLRMEHTSFSGMGAAAPPKVLCSVLLYRAKTKKTRQKADKIVNTSARNLVRIEDLPARKEASVFQYETAGQILAENMRKRKKTFSCENLSNVLLLT